MERANEIDVEGLDIKRRNVGITKETRERDQQKGEKTRRSRGGRRSQGEMKRMRRRKLMRWRRLHLQSQKKLTHPKHKRCHISMTGSWIVQQHRT